MKKNLFFAIALACILTSPAFVSCSKELAIEPEEQAPKEEEPGTNPEEVKTRGYWKEGQFIELKTDDQTKFLVMPRLTDNTISSEEVKAVLDSIGVEIEGTSQLYKGRFWVNASIRPEHPSLYVSNKYKSSVKTSERDYLFILPKISVCMKKNVSLDAFLEKYGKHFTQKGIWREYDEEVIYTFDCDCFNSDEILDLIMTIHDEETVLWCEPSINAPIVPD